MTTVLPRTSTSLKSSQPYSGATMPYPTNTTSLSLTSKCVAMRLVGPTKSLIGVSGNGFPPMVKVRVGVDVMPTSGTSCR